MIKKLIFLVNLSLYTSIFAMDWNEIIEKHKELIPDNSLMIRQYEAFCDSNAPAIADIRIKEIPIVENQEALVDLKTINIARISMMPQPTRPFEGSTYNSGLPNASKMRVTIFQKLKQMVAALDDLAVDFGYEHRQVDILVFEALRDLGTQKMLYDKKLAEILLAKPGMSLEMGEKETARWVSPVKNNIPVHSTGAAVDLRLWDNKNQCFLDLGPFGVIWGDSPFAPTFSEGITDTQKNNRLFCLLAAERAGLTNYAYEWWHYSFGDRYSVYWNDQNNPEKFAQYGSIE